MFSQEGFRRHNHAGGTETALYRAMPDKGLLDFRELTILLDSLDGQHFTPLGIEGKEQAAVD